jgi:hypothetical protein
MLAQYCTTKTESSTADGWTRTPQFKNKNIFL